MSWQPEIDALREREALAQRMGGEEKVKRQHDAGKLTVRERIDKLLDPGSFHEIGGDDFTVRGGAADAAIYQKQVIGEQFANEMRIPLVRLVDGTGGGGSVKTLETTG